MVARFYSGNDSSLMINLPVKFIRGNFEYFLGRLNNVFYEEGKCPSVVCFNNITFRIRTFCVNLTIFNSILSTSWEERIKGDLPPGSLKQ